MIVLMLPLALAVIMIIGLALGKLGFFGWLSRMAGKVLEPFKENEKDKGRGQ